MVSDGLAVLSDAGLERMVQLLREQQTRKVDVVASVANIRARNGAMSNRLEAASTRLNQIQGAVNEQLSNTEDADFAKTMIEFSQQSAAYQASLRAGANIVQSSLMDFLR